MEVTGALGVRPDRLQLDKLSSLGKWIFETGTKHNFINKTLTALDVEPEPDVEYLLGDRYLDFSLCLVFAFAFPFIRAILRKYVYEVRGDPGARGRRGRGAGEGSSFSCCLLTRTRRSRRAHRSIRQSSPPLIGLGLRSVWHRWRTVWGN